MCVCVCVSYWFDQKELRCSRNYACVLVRGCTHVNSQWLLTFTIHTCDGSQTHLPVHDSCAWFMFAHMIQIGVQHEHDGSCCKHEPARFSSWNCRKKAWDLDDFEIAAKVLIRCFCRKATDRRFRMEFMVATQTMGSHICDKHIFVFINIYIYVT